MGKIIEVNGENFRCHDWFLLATLQLNSVAMVEKVKTLDHFWW